MSPIGILPKSSAIGAAAAPVLALTSSASEAGMVAEERNAPVDPSGTTQASALNAFVDRRASLSKLVVIPDRTRVMPSTERGADDADREAPAPELQVTQADQDHGDPSFEVDPARPPTD